MLEQVIAFLDSSKKVAFKSTKRIELYNHLPPEDVPLRALCCPLIGLAMEDPVDISSGCNFERRDIQEWFDVGNNTCPKSCMVLTKVP